MDYLILILVFGAMYFVCKELETASQAISYRLSLPASVSGATLLAISSSCPEFFTSALGAIIHGKFEIGLTVILWSAIFNILVIPGLSALFAPANLKISKDVLLRDGAFYLFTTILLVILISDGNHTRSEALILTGTYFVYGLILYFMKENSGEMMEKISMTSARMVISFGGSIVIIAILCHIMLKSGMSISLSLEIPLVLMSALIFASGTSIPDLLLSIFAARRGSGSAAISNALGSNVFDLTICLGIPILIVGDTVLEIDSLIKISVWMLIFSTLLVIVMMKSRWQLSKPGGCLLLATYLIMVSVLICIWRLGASLPTEIWKG